MSPVTDSDPIIKAFVNLIHPAFVLVVANTAFSASLFTLFVILLALSTKESRRRVVFRLNAFAICIVLTMGILVGYGYSKIVVGHFNQLSTTAYVVITAFIVFPPLLYDSILLTRLFALYPFSNTRSTTLLKIFAFPLCVKCSRVVALTLYIRSVTVGGHTPWLLNRNLIAEWTMQIADNMYSVILFLYNLHVRTGSIKRPGGMPACIRQIFYISTANFVIPLILNVVLIIVFATSWLSTARGLLWLIHIYVTVMGVLCATVWFSRPEWVRTRNRPIADDMFALKPHLRGVHDSEVVVDGKGSSTPGIADLDAEPVTDCKQPSTPKEEEKYCTV
ncbi:hypothetical protein EDC04DRAFT_85830 [Pisolithus marmoratus]|nr:hypothetical protein EDC04DRAFT_85830 [Pisolithus marmoratus]